MGTLFSSFQRSTRKRPEQDVRTEIDPCLVFGFIATFLFLWTVFTTAGFTVVTEAIIRKNETDDLLRWTDLAVSQANATSQAT